MLIGLNDPDMDKRYATAKAIKEEIGPRATIFDTTDFNETVEILKKYSLYKRETRILIHPLQEVAIGSSKGLWRAGEYLYARRGGIYFGEPAKEETISHKGPIPDKLSNIIDMGSFYWQRALYLKRESPRLFGRATTDPHTLVIGYRPSWPRLSHYADHTIAGFPSEWWKGVGFFVPSRAIKATEELTQIFYTYPDAARVAVTANAQKYLDDMGAAYQLMDLKLPRMVDDNVKYGNRLRELARLDGERIVDYTAPI